MNMIKTPYTVADNFNKYFVNVGTNLASKIEPSKKSFESYLNRSNEELQKNKLSNEELLKAVSSLKPNKSPGIID